jgi:hypothetical protein
MGGDLGQNVFAGAANGFMGAMRSYAINEAAVTRASAGAKGDAGSWVRPSLAEVLPPEQFGALLDATIAEGLSAYDAENGQTALACRLCGQIGMRILQHPAARTADQWLYRQGEKAWTVAGRFGERFVQELTYLAKNVERIPVGLRLRVPDLLNEAGRRIGEVKNVAYQALTSQLRDYIQIALDRNLTFDLYVRAGEATRLSAPLLEAEAQGLVNIIRTIPPP